MSSRHGPRPTRPRLDPLPVERWAEGARRALRVDDDGDQPVLGIFATIAHHPDLLRRWLVFGNHVLSKSTLDPRDRELAILRIGWNCGAAYEWGQHAVIGREAGLDDDDLVRIAAGPDADGWSPHEAAILRAADELWSDACMTDATWEELADTYSAEQLLDLIFTCGQYVTVSMALNSLGVQPEAGVEGFPEMPG